MTSMVLNLQKLALQGNSSITALLMQALVVARKLKIKEFEIWIKNELDGYQIGANVPDYRKNRCQIKMQNPYHGWQNIVYASNEKEEILSNVQVLQPISEIEKLREYGPGEFIMPIPSEIVLHIQKSVGAVLPVERFVPKTAIDKICEAVRKFVLEWALDLEEQGILGGEISFSDEEKTLAAKVVPQFYFAGNFNGVLGDVNNSSVSQTIDASVNKNDFASLRNALKDIGIEEEDIGLLENAIKSEPTIESPKKLGVNVSEWIGKMTSKAVNGTWKIATNLSSQILVRAICHFYGF